jgi:hypothetical protein
MCTKGAERYRATQPDELERRVERYATEHPDPESADPCTDRNTERNNQQVTPTRDEPKPIEISQARRNDECRENGNEDENNLPNGAHIGDEARAERHPRDE